MTFFKMQFLWFIHDNEGNFIDEDGIVLNEENIDEHKLQMTLIIVAYKQTYKYENHYR